MRNKNLFIVFAILVFLVLLSRVFDRKRSETYDPEVVRVDTATVTRILLAPRAENGALITLERMGDSWQASMGETVETVAASKVSPLLAAMQMIRARGVAAKSPDDWVTYEIDDTSASRVQVFAGNDKVADFLVGAFKFDQVRQSASSYVRRAGEDEVYLVEGFLGMQFNRGFNAFRNTSLLRLDPVSLNSIRYTIPESGEDLAIAKNPDGLWYLAGMEQLDSAAMMQYVTGLTNVTSTDFTDPQALAGYALAGEITFGFAGVAEPVVVRSFTPANGAYDFVLSSDMNPSNAFGSDSAGVYQRVFGKLNELLERQ